MGMQTIAQARYAGWEAGRRFELEHTVAGAPSTEVHAMPRDIPARVKRATRQTRFILAEILVMVGGAIPPPPPSTRITARLKCVQEHR